MVVAVVIVALALAWYEFLWWFSSGRTTDAVREYREEQQWAALEPKMASGATGLAELNALLEVPAKFVPPSPPYSLTQAVAVHRGYSLGHFVRPDELPEATPPPATAPTVAVRKIMTAPIQDMDPEQSWYEHCEGGEREFAGRA